MKTKSEFNQKLGLRLEQARLMKCWSIGQLAEISKVSAAQISKYESGLVTPMAETLKTLSNFLSCPADILLGTRFGEPGNSKRKWKSKK